ncbi:hypothetical protein [Flavobacterium sp. IMCC34518]|uniref:hypothetical protein n=1 Tax=Flavobacterium sp. IMCC34518 TaxID=3003623 RepID=UPI0022AC05CA|nr:hypothetical protein [Flavobacterium sp. IMCC34518]
MKNIFKNWRTTSTGIVMCAGAIVAFINDKTQIIPCLTAFLGGIGLIFSKDSNQTGVAK